MDQAAKPVAYHTDSKSQWYKDEHLEPHWDEHGECYQHKNKYKYGISAILRLFFANIFHRHNKFSIS